MYRAAALGLARTAEPDLVLLDVDLPDGSGYRCSCRLQSENDYNLSRAYCTILAEKTTACQPASLSIPASFSLRAKAFCRSPTL